MRVKRVGAKYISIEFTDTEKTKIAQEWNHFSNYVLNIQGVGSIAVSQLNLSPTEMATGKVPSTTAEMDYMRILAINVFLTSYNDDVQVVEPVITEMEYKMAMV